MSNETSTGSFPDWVADAVFYQIFPDRFQRTPDLHPQLTFEEWDSAPTPYGFKGGDLDGVTARLDELCELGVTALYLNPIFSSASNHRYHTFDYYTVDPLLGGNAAFDRLLAAAHDRRMRVVLDGVFNHAGRGFWPFHHVMETGGHSPYRDWFHFHPDFLSGEQAFHPYPSGGQADALRHGAGSYETLGYSAWWNLPALPKFNTQHEGAREFLLQVGEHWVRRGIDGWRLDVPNEINDDNFWREFRSRCRAVRSDCYIVGEVWGEAQRWLQGDMWDAVMNYQLTAACLGFFGGDRLDLAETRRPSSFRHVQAISAGEFAEEIDRLEGSYSAAVNHCQMNLLDSHDMPRFLTCVGGHAAGLRQAFLLTCLLPGAPCIYYGDEVAMEGRQDPDCRRAYPRNISADGLEMRNWYRQCLEMRREFPAARYGTRTWYLEGEDVLGLTLQMGGHPTLVVCVNRSSARRPVPEGLRECLKGSLHTVIGRPELSAEALPATIEEEGVWVLATT